MPTQEQVDQIARELAPDVVRIRCYPGVNWYDAPVIRFKVVLKDHAFREGNLMEVTEKIERRVVDSLGLAGSERTPLFRFRSESDQARVREVSWE